jgi:hypothetical protein
LKGGQHAAVVIVAANPLDGDSGRLHPKTLFVVAATATATAAAAATTDTTITTATDATATTSTATTYTASTMADKGALVVDEAANAVKLWLGF